VSIRRGSVIACPSYRGGGVVVMVKFDGRVRSSPALPSGASTTELPRVELARELASDCDAIVRAVAYAPPRQPRSTLAPGTRWSESGRYLIDRQLGRGG